MNWKNSWKIINKRVKILHNVENFAFLRVFFVPSYEGNLQKKGWESFFEISKWTKINVQNRFFQILYEKLRFVTIIEFYRQVTKKIIQNL
jgi:hypothetical protein